MQPPSATETLLRQIVTTICRKTPDPLVQYSDNDYAILIRVNACDHGRVVGKKGIVIWALTTIAWYADLASGRVQRRIKLIDPIDGGMAVVFPFKPCAKWDSDMVCKMVESVVSACVKDKGSWVLEKTGDGEATMHIKLDAYLHTACSNPDLEEAIGVIIRSAGMANGCVIKVECVWS